MILRIRPETYDRLRTMARRANQTLPEFVDCMIREHERRQFLEGLNSDYARLQKTPVAWQEEIAERDVFESAYELDDFMPEAYSMPSRAN
jgi:hypothetical protein